MLISFLSITPVTGLRLALRLGLILGLVIGSNLDWYPDSMGLWIRIRITLGIHYALVIMLVLENIPNCPIFG